MQQKIMNTAVQKSTTLKKRVMVVDDHPIVRQGLSQLINQEHDIEVCCEADSISDAMNTILTCNPDIAIVDIALGQSNGIRLIEEMSQQHPNIPVLALSMHDESLYAERCLKAGAKGYIMKKEAPENVIVALKKILKGDVHISDVLSAKLLHKFIIQDKGDNRSPMDRLSNRELEVFEYIGKGLKTREIAAQLHLSIKTIETYVDHIKKKMNFRDSRDLFMHAVKWSLDTDTK